MIEILERIFIFVVVGKNWFGGINISLIYKICGFYEFYLFWKKELKFMFYF